MATTIEDALQQWSKVELENLKKDLDDDALAMEQRRKERDECRSRLKSQTQAFRKTLNEEMRTAFKPLLSLYQTEVQGLVKMCKQSEKSFLSIYERLVAVPDPTPFLTRVKALSDEVKQLKMKNTDLELQVENKDKTLQDYRSRLSGSKDQDTTIQRLQEELAELERDVDARVEVKLKEHVRRMEQDNAAKQQHYEAERATLLQRVLEAEATAQTSASNAKESVTQALDARNQYEDEIDALNRAADMAHNQLEAANARVEELESELAHCREQLQDALTAERDAAATAANTSMHDAINADLESELQLKDREIARLLSNHHSLQTQITSLTADYEARLSNADSELTSARQEAARLRSALDGAKDYDDIKNELAILRRIEFGETSDATSQPLEVLLKRKNAQLESENTRLRNEYDSLKTAFDAFKEEHVEVSATIKEQGELISRLEDHLATVDPNTSATNSHSNRTSQQHTPSLASRHVGDGGDGMSEIELSSPSSASSSSLRPVRTPAALVTPTDVNNANAGNSGVLLGIVTSQRDRFRQRIVELESEVGRERQQRQSMQNQVDQIRADNIKLYEKIRYLQSYNNNTGTGSSSSSSRHTSTTRGNDPLLNKYASEYEDKISPFHEFSSKERQRRIMNLNAGDRLTLTLGKAVMGSKNARLIFLGYAIIVHLLIFVVLYKYSHAGVTRQNLAETCHQFFAAHHLSQETAVDHAHGIHFDSEQLHDSGGGGVD
ncbi:hypothetical protein PTSG_00349 [Salpingoeca rosetta]|uniref:Protein CASP n=1 Tax=Salpingoeca rosetta (strain ATCC 50818 / BSB-021) TaxID=946362 RepID=F2TW84_SALR5|nr:uncharacterized protein PTSG_00349 [Salpingoeca rosetta]EGD72330.1 hypothetical protein PTSG_00349 [Salpingoeca rosetta]|eukprot:XP_004998900.1 hypothetical protein PTSG_00349 [Salpingoeca rosetta]